MSLTFREVQKMKVFGDKMQWKIFEPKRGELAAELEVLYNEKFHASYHLPHICMGLKIMEVEMGSVYS